MQAACRAPAVLAALSLLALAPAGTRAGVQPASTCSRRRFVNESEQPRSAVRRRSASTPTTIGSTITRRAAPHGARRWLRLGAAHRAGDAAGRSRPTTMPTPTNCSTRSISSCSKMRTTNRCSRPDRLHRHNRQRRLHADRQALRAGRRAPRARRAAPRLIPGVVAAAEAQPDAPATRDDLASDRRERRQPRRCTAA
jgi:hypothetical protein